MKILASLALSPTGRRRRAVALAALWTLLAVPSTLARPLGPTAPDKWRPHPEVGILERVTLNVHWHDTVELLRAAAVANDVDDGNLRGFSILRRNTATGDWVCDVFVVRMRGALVDKERTMTIGHEILHCFGFRHDE